VPHRRWSASTRRQPSAILRCRLSVRAHLRSRARHRLSVRFHRRLSATFRRPLSSVRFRHQLCARWAAACPSARRAEVSPAAAASPAAGADLAAARCSPTRLARAQSLQPAPV
jgi:hypothetical protein